MTLGSITKDSGMILASRLVISFSNLLFIPILTKNLSASDYGIWAQVWVTIPLVGAFIILGFDESIARFFPTKDKKEYSKDLLSLLMPIIIMSLATSFAIYLLSGPISSLLFEENRIIAKYLSLIVLIWSLDLIFFAFLRGLRRMKFTSLLLSMHNIVEMGLATFFVLTGRGIEGAILSILFTRSGLLVVLLAYSRNLVDLVRPRLSNAKIYAIYGMPTLPMVLSGWILSSFDRYMIAMFYSSTEVGYYDPAYILGQSIPFLIAGALGYTLTPHLSTLLHDGNAREVKNTLSFMMKMAIAINVPFILGGIVVSKSLLSLISTEVISQNAYRVLPLVAVGVSFYSFKIILSQIWMLEKKTAMIGLTFSFSAAVNVILNIFLIPKYGLEGAAIATLFAYGADLLITYILVNKELMPRVGWMNLSKIFSSSLAMFIMVYLIYSYSPLLQNSLAIILGVFVYLSITKAINIFSDYEKEVIRDLGIPKFLFR